MRGHGQKEREERSGERRTERRKRWGEKEESFDGDTKEKREKKGCGEEKNRR